MQAHLGGPSTYRASGRWLVSTIAVACALGACEEPLPAGQLFVNVDTDVMVPDFMDRIRVDAYTVNGRTWLESREYLVGASAPETTDAGDQPTGAKSLPASFAITVKDGSARALLRVRGFRAGKVRDYRGERFSEAPPPVDASALPPVCARAPVLAVNESLDVAVRADATMPPLTCGDASTAVGSTVVALAIDRAGKFRVRLDQQSPGGSWSIYGRPLLAIVDDCESQRRVLDCTPREQAEDVSGLSTELEPGTHYLLIGNREPAAMELRVTLVPLDSDGGVLPSPDAGLQHASGADAGLRLFAGKFDVTPRTEPDPAVAIDRLALVETSTTQDRTVTLMLEGDCFGMMADLYGQRTCIGGLMTALGHERAVSGVVQRVGSASGNWTGERTVDCRDASADPERACVPGGAFTLGSTAVVAGGPDSSVPERVVVMGPFFMDRHEFSVRKYRNLVKSDRAPRAGATPSGDALDFKNKRDAGNYCTYNEMPGSHDPVFVEREDLPLTCISWDAATEICRGLGGRLPTSAEWEFAAASSGKKGGQTLYPWGSDPPTCSMAVFARWGDNSHGHDDCFASSGFGPAPVDDPMAMLRDTTPDGIVGLGGNVSEWTSDSHRAYSDPCWAAKPMRNPHCDDGRAALRTVKGASWRQPAAFTRAPTRLGAPPTAPDDGVGFRCAYDAVPR